METVPESVGLEETLVDRDEVIEDVTVALVQAVGDADVDAL